MIHQQQLLFPNMKFHLVRKIYIGAVFGLAAMLYDMKTFSRWLQKQTGGMIGGFYEQQRI